MAPPADQLRPTNIGGHILGAATEAFITLAQSATNPVALAKSETIVAGISVSIGVRHIL